MVSTKLILTLLGGYMILTTISSAYSSIVLQHRTDRFRLQLLVIIGIVTALSLPAFYSWFQYASKMTPRLFIGGLLLLFTSYFLSIVLSLLFSILYKKRRD